MTHAALPDYEPAAPPDPVHLPEPVQVQLLLTGKWISQAISAVAKLGVADLLTEGPEPVEELARATGTDAGMLYRVLRATAAVGVFAELPDGRIALTPLFNEVPEGADAYLLRAVLHDWSDDESVAILTNVRRAIGANPDARLLIMEIVVGRGNAWDFGKLVDIEMLVNVGGQERTEDEWRQLLERSGFELESVTATMPPMSIIVGRPACA